MKADRNFLAALMLMAAGVSRADTCPTADNSALPAVTTTVESVNQSIRELSTPREYGPPTSVADVGASVSYGFSKGWYPLIGFNCDFWGPAGAVYGSVEGPIEKKNKLEGTHHRAGFEAHAIPGCTMDDNYKWMTQHMPDPPRAKPFSITIAIDAYVHDLNFYKGEDPKSYKDDKEFREWKERELRMRKTLHMLSINSEIAIVGTPPSDENPGFAKAQRAWLGKELLRAPEQYKNIRLYPLAEYYDQWKKDEAEKGSKAVWNYQCNGHSLSIPVKDILNPHDFYGGRHPTRLGTLLITNHLIEMILKERPDWEGKYLNYRDSYYEQKMPASVRSKAVK